MLLGSIKKAAIIVDEGKVQYMIIPIKTCTENEALFYSDK